MDDSLEPRRDSTEGGEVGSRGGPEADPPGGAGSAHRYEAGLGSPGGASSRGAGDGGTGSEGGDPSGEDDGPPDPARRRFLARLALGLGGAAGAVAAVPWLAVFLNPAQRRDPEIWRPVGRVDEFPLGRTVQVTYLETTPLPWAGFSGRDSAWVRRDGDQDFIAFSSYCTHIGCPVRWEPGAQLFLCPCHGGAFHPDGRVAAGPPPRPLDRHPIRIRDGVVELRAEGVPPPER